MVHGFPHIQMPNKVCDKCLISKQPRSSFSIYTPLRAKDLLNVVYSDVCGPIEVPTVGGNRYFVSFVDEFSRKIWLYLIKVKSDTFSMFKTF